MMVGRDLKTRQQYINERNRANIILGFISGSVSSRTADVIFEL